MTWFFVTTKVATVVIYGLSKQLGNTCNSTALKPHLCHVVINMTISFWTNYNTTSLEWWMQDWCKYLKVAEHVRLGNYVHLPKWFIHPSLSAVGCWIALLQPPDVRRFNLNGQRSRIPDTGDKFSSPFAFSQAAWGSQRSPRCWCRVPKIWQTCHVQLEKPGYFSEPFNISLYPSISHLIVLAGWYVLHVFFHDHD